MYTFFTDLIMALLFTAFSGGRHMAWLRCMIYLVYTLDIFLPTRADTVSAIYTIVC